MADTYYDPERYTLLQTTGEAVLRLGPGWRPRPIQVPIAVVLGHFERLTEEELHDLRRDISVEIGRRNTLPKEER